MLSNTKQCLCCLTLTAHLFKEVGSLGQLIKMDEDHSIWALRHRNYLELIYYEYIYEHDYRLQIARNSSLSLNNTQKVVTPDNRIVHRSNHEKKSKFTEKLIQPARENKVLIYERTASFGANEKWRMSENIPEDSQHLRRNNYPQIMIIMVSLNIDPRKRWNKLYNRTTSMKVTRQSLSAEILSKMIQLRRLLPAKESAKRLNAEGHIQTNAKVSRILIYRRCQLELHDDDRCFPSISIWNESCLLEVVDEVSGQCLSHITLLCRDVICECSKCTTGCSTEVLLCYVCRLKHGMETPGANESGSCAEDCLLPPFYVQNDANYAGEKLSDIDVMIDIGYTVGFDGKDCNIMAIIESGNSPPGYLQLRDIKTGELICVSRINSIRCFKADKIAGLHHRIHSRIIHSFQHGPAEATVLAYPGRVISFSRDTVLYWSCPSWPPIAIPWVNRKRYCNWPSTEAIQVIVSKGCRVVHKPHELSKLKEFEFRFSFSEAELILFKTLTCDQRKCFIAFKALIKSNIYKLEHRTREEIKLSSYCLKTIFLLGV